MTANALPNHARTIINGLVRGAQIWRMHSECTTNAPRMHSQKWSECTPKSIVFGIVLGWILPQCGTLFVLIAIHVATKSSLLPRSKFVLTLVCFCVVLGAMLPHFRRHRAPFYNTKSVLAPRTPPSLSQLSRFFLTHVDSELWNKTGM